MTQKINSLSDNKKLLESVETFVKSVYVCPICHYSSYTIIDKVCTIHSRDKKGMLPITILTCNKCFSIQQLNLSAFMAENKWLE